MTTLEHIKCAAELNQKGASLLAAGDYDAAFPCIHNALKIVTAASQNPLLLMREHSRHGELMPPPYLLTLPPNANDGDDVAAAVEKPSCCCYQEGESINFIYSKPFFFNPEASYTQEEISSYGAIILFNMSLIYHHKAKTIGSSALLTARHLYDICLELLKSGSRFDCSNVIIALLNNRASLNDDLLEYDESYQNFRLLADLISKRIVRTDTLDTEDLRDIFLNIQFYKIPTCAAAA